MKKIAVLGLGAMGSRVAINLLDTGYDEVPMPIVSAVQGVFADAIAQGYGKDNITGIIQLFAQP